MIEISTTDDDINERNIDECVACSPPASHELSRPHQLSRSHDSDPDLGTGKFIREVGVRRRLSLEVVKRKSLSPQRWVWPSDFVFYHGYREEEVPRTPSPWSQISKYVCDNNKVVLYVVLVFIVMKLFSQSKFLTSTTYISCDVSVS